MIGEQPASCEVGCPKLTQLPTTRKGPPYAPPPPCRAAMLDRRIVDSTLTPGQLLARPGHYCHWCGAHIDIGLTEDTTSSPKYCNRTHQTKNYRVRNAHRARKLREARETDFRCPHPNKKHFKTRGQAILEGRILKLRPYLCNCGLYHLTSREGPNL